MCGIAGWYGVNLSSHKRVEQILAMLEIITHRGPDELGYYSDPQVTLGNTRLSIIDITSGQQPLSDQRQRYWITYNGEIYNYKELMNELLQLGYQFRTNSDTEVVLAAWIIWGEQAFARLNGAFACALYDKETHTLVLVRDRFGKRPLFYHYDSVNHELRFASELKSFLKDPKLTFRWDIHQLANIFNQWAPIADQTPFLGFKQLTEGCYMTLTPKTLHISEYTSLSFKESLYKGSEMDAAEELQALLEQSVRLRLRSDVEVGVYMSGGLDSSIVSHLVTKMSQQPVRSFSITFDDQDFNESDKQIILANKFRSKHCAVNINNIDIAENFPHALWHTEIPQFRTAFVPMYLLAKAVKEAGIKVVLTGEGADEGFLGYDIFRETVLRHELQKGNKSGVVEDILARLYTYLPHLQQRQESMLGVYNQFLVEKTPGLFSHEPRFHNAAFSLRLFNRDVKPLGELIELLANVPGVMGWSPVERGQWLECKTLLTGYLLSSQGDRMSLAHSVEGRCPFLDKEVIAFANRLPQSYKLKNGIEKYILKRAFEKDLPAEIIRQPKQPYRAPDAIAFKGTEGKLLPQVEELLSIDEIKKIDFLSADFCSKLSSKIARNAPETISHRENHAFLQLMSLVWLNHYFIEKKYPRALINKPRLTCQVCID